MNWNSEMLVAATPSRRDHPMDRTVICPDCRQRRTIPARYYSTYTRQGLITEGRDGKLYCRCQLCKRRRRAAEMRAHRSDKLAGSALDRIRGAGGATSTPGDRAFLAWLAGEGRRLDDKDAPFAIVSAASQGDDVAGKTLKLLLEEDMLRKMGGGDVEHGRDVRRAILATHRANDGPRPGQAVALVARARLRHDFVLCPLCHLLVYRVVRGNQARAKVAAGEKVACWHSVCWHAWLASPQVKAWFAEKLHIQQVGAVRPAHRPKMPMPPPPPRADPALLRAGYRALAGHAAGASYAQLAATATTAEGRRISEGAIQQRIRALRRRLPASWGHVFGAAGGLAKGNEARQHLYPLPDRIADLLPGRAPDAAALAGLGIPAATIAQVIGHAPGSPGERAAQAQ